MNSTKITLMGILILAAFSLFNNISCAAECEVTKSEKILELDPENKLGPKNNKVASGHPRVFRCGNSKTDICVQYVGAVYGKSGDFRDGVQLTSEYRNGDLLQGFTLVIDQRGNVKNIEDVNFDTTSSDSKNGTSMVVRDDKVLVAFCTSLKDLEIATKDHKDKDNDLEREKKHEHAVLYQAVYWCPDGKTKPEETTKTAMEKYIEYKDKVSLTHPPTLSLYANFMYAFDHLKPSGRILRGDNSPTYASYSSCCAGCSCVTC